MAARVHLDAPVLPRLNLEQLTRKEAALHDFRPQEDALDLSSSFVTSSSDRSWQPARHQLQGQAHLMSCSQSSSSSMPYSHRAETRRQHWGSLESSWLAKNAFTGWVDVTASSSGSGGGMRPPNIGQLAHAERQSQAAELQEAMSRIQQQLLRQNKDVVGKAVSTMAEARSKALEYERLLMRLAFRSLVRASHRTRRLSVFNTSNASNAPSNGGLKILFSPITVAHFPLLVAQRVVRAWYMHSSMEIASRSHEEACRELTTRLFTRSRWMADRLALGALVQIIAQKCFNEWKLEVAASANAGQTARQLGHLRLRSRIFYSWQHALRQARWVAAMEDASQQLEGMLEQRRHAHIDFLDASMQRRRLLHLFFLAWRAGQSALQRVAQMVSKTQRKSAKLLLRLFMVSWSQVALACRKLCAGLEQVPLQIGSRLCGSRAGAARTLVAWQRAIMIEQHHRAMHEELDECLQFRVLLGWWHVRRSLAEHQHWVATLAQGKDTLHVGVCLREWRGAVLESQRQKSHEESRTYLTSKQNLLIQRLVQPRRAEAFVSHCYSAWRGRVKAFALAHSLRDVYKRALLSRCVVNWSLAAWAMAQQDTAHEQLLLGRTFQTWVRSCLLLQHRKLAAASLGGRIAQLEILGIVSAWKQACLEERWHSAMHEALRQLSVELVSQGRHAVVDSLRRGQTSVTLIALFSRWRYVSAVEQVRHQTSEMIGQERSLLSRCLASWRRAIDAIAAATRLHKIQEDGRKHVLAAQCISAWKQVIDVNADAMKDQHLRALLILEARWFAAWHNATATTLCLWDFRTLRPCNAIRQRQHLRNRLEPRHGPSLVIHDESSRPALLQLQISLVLLVQVFTAWRQRAAYQKHQQTVSDRLYNRNTSKLKGALAMRIVISWHKWTQSGRSAWQGAMCVARRRGLLELSKPFQAWSWACAFSKWQAAAEVSSRNITASLFMRAAEVADQLLLLSSSQALLSRCLMVWAAASSEVRWTRRIHINERATWGAERICAKVACSWALLTWVRNIAERRDFATHFLLARAVKAWLKAWGEGSAARRAALILEHSSERLLAKAYFGAWQKVRETARWQAMLQSQQLAASRSMATQVEEEKQLFQDVASGFKFRLHLVRLLAAWWQMCQNRAFASNLSWALEKTTSWQLLARVLNAWGQAYQVLAVQAEARLILAARHEVHAAARRDAQLVALTQELARRGTTRSCLLELLTIMGSSGYTDCRASQRCFECLGACLSRQSLAAVFAAWHLCQACAAQLWQQQLKSDAVTIRLERLSSRQTLAAVFAAWQQKVKADAVAIQLERLTSRNVARMLLSDCFVTWLASRLAGLQQDKVPRASRQQELRTRRQVRRLLASCMAIWVTSRLAACRRGTAEEMKPALLQRSSSVRTLCEEQELSSHARAPASSQAHGSNSKSPTSPTHALPFVEEAAELLEQAADVLESDIFCEALSLTSQAELLERAADALESG
eukprot:TRINITY_DN30114_c0_g1_i1.p1 TRINITY_DN30114_c0_g1~~TRINITY_DN30114_c0_g1_i1.p1  ORF type:complete len:1473 (-),score=235.74 TRINITY_DN30114_c0_g1_i1:112-4530(-)